MFAFVEFKHAFHAETAYNEMHQTEIIGAKISIMWSKSPPSKKWKPTIKDPNTDKCHPKRSKYSDSASFRHQDRARDPDWDWDQKRDLDQDLDQDLDRDIHVDRDQESDLAFETRSIFSFSSKQIHPPSWSSWSDKKYSDRREEFSSSNRTKHILQNSFKSRFYSPGSQTQNSFQPHNQSHSHHRSHFNSHPQFQDQDQGQNQTQARNHDNSDSTSTSNPNSGLYDVYYDTDEKTILFLSRMHPKTIRADIEPLFSKYGPLVACFIPKHKFPPKHNPKQNLTNVATGFVEYTHPNNAAVALRILNNTSILGAKIQIRYSRNLTKLQYNLLISPNSQNRVAYKDKKRHLIPDINQDHEKKRKRKREREIEIERDLADRFDQGSERGSEIDFDRNKYLSYERALTPDMLIHQSRALSLNLYDNPNQTGDFRRNIDDENASTNNSVRDMDFSRNIELDDPSRLYSGEGSFSRRKNLSPSSHSLTSRYHTHQREIDRYGHYSHKHYCFEDRIPIDRTPRSPSDFSKHDRRRPDIENIRPTRYEPSESNCRFEIYPNYNSHSHGHSNFRSSNSVSIRNDYLYHPDKLSKDLHDSKEPYRSIDFFHSPSGARHIDYREKTHYTSERHGSCKHCMEESGRRQCYENRYDQLNAHEGQKSYDYYGYHDSPRNTYQHSNCPNSQYLEYTAPEISIKGISRQYTSPTYYEEEAETGYCNHSSSRHTIQHQPHSDFVEHYAEDYQDRYRPFDSDHKFHNSGYSNKSIHPCDHNYRQRSQSPHSSHNRYQPVEKANESTNETEPQNKRARYDNIPSKDSTKSGIGRYGSQFNNKQIPIPKHQSHHGIRDNNSNNDSLPFNLHGDKHNHDHDHDHDNSRSGNLLGNTHRPNSGIILNLKDNINNNNNNKSFVNSSGPSNKYGMTHGFSSTPPQTPTRFSHSSNSVLSGSRNSFSNSNPSARPNPNAAERPIPSIYKDYDTGFTSIPRVTKSSSAKKEKHINSFNEVSGDLATRTKTGLSSNIQSRIGPALPTVQEQHMQAAQLLLQQLDALSSATSQPTFLNKSWVRDMPTSEPTNTQNQSLALRDTKGLIQDSTKPTAPKTETTSATRASSKSNTTSNQTNKSHQHLPNAVSSTSTSTSTDTYGKISKSTIRKPVPVFTNSVSKPANLVLAKSAATTLNFKDIIDLTIPPKTSDSASSSIAKAIPNSSLNLYSNPSSNITNYSNDKPALATSTVSTESKLVDPRLNTKSMPTVSPTSALTSPSSPSMSPNKPAITESAKYISSTNKTTIVTPHTASATTVNSDTNNVNPVISKSSVKSNASSSAFAAATIELHNIYLSASSASTLASASASASATVAINKKALGSKNFTITSANAVNITDTNNNVISSKSIAITKLASLNSSTSKTTATTAVNATKPEQNRKTTFAAITTAQKTPSGKQRPNSNSDTKTSTSVNKNNSNSNSNSNSQSVDTGISSIEKKIVSHAKSVSDTSTKPSTSVLLGNTVIESQKRKYDDEGWSSHDINISTNSNQSTNKNNGDGDGRGWGWSWEDASSCGWENNWNTEAEPNSSPKPKPKPKLSARLYQSLSSGPNTNMSVSSTANTSLKKEPGAKPEDTKVKDKNNSNSTRGEKDSDRTLNSNRDIGWDQDHAREWKTENSIAWSTDWNKMRTGSDLDHHNDTNTVNDKDKGIDKDRNKNRDYNKSFNKTWNSDWISSYNKHYSQTYTGEDSKDYDKNYNIDHSKSYNNKNDKSCDKSYGRNSTKTCSKDKSRDRDWSVDGERGRCRARSRSRNRGRGRSRSRDLDQSHTGTRSHNLSSAKPADKFYDSSQYKNSITFVDKLRSKKYFSEKADPKSFYEPEAKITNGSSYAIDRSSSNSLLSFSSNDIEKPESNYFHLSYKGQYHDQYKDQSQNQYQDQGQNKPNFLGCNSTGEFLAVDKHKLGELSDVVSQNRPPNTNITFSSNEEVGEETLESEVGVILSKGFVEWG